LLYQLLKIQAAKEPGLTKSFLHNGYQPPNNPTTGGFGTLGGACAAGRKWAEVTAPCHYLQVHREHQLSQRDRISRRKGCEKQFHCGTKLHNVLLLNTEEKEKVLNVNK